MLSIIERTQLVPVRGEPRALTSGRAFGLTLDQRFLYPSDSYLSVVQEARRALQCREGLVVITGDAGTGKSMLCRTLLEQLEPSACASIVLDPYLSLEELLVHILTDFGVIDASWSGQLRPVTPARHQLVALLQQFLNSLIPLGAYVVIIIDEAQHLQPAVLEQLRVLLNFETEQGKLLQLVLVGQPDLNVILQRPEVRRLNERVARRCVLRPLLPDEVTGYIERRLLIADRLHRVREALASDAATPTVSAEPAVAFTPAAVAAVTRLSGGVPRHVNLLCESAIEIGGAQQMVAIDARTVRSAATHLNPVPGTRRASAAAVAGAMVLVLAAGSAVWTWADEPSPPPAAGDRIEPSASRDAAATLVPEHRPLPLADSANVAVASFRTERQAAAAVASLEARGLPVFIRSDTAWQQVVVGPYVSLEEASVVQGQLVREGYDTARVFVEAAYGR